MIKKLYLSSIILAAFMVSCSKETETLQADTPSDYFSFQKGKYILYDLDSTLFINFGQKDTVVSYEVKDVVDEEVTDNLQRQAWRIIRYIRPSGSTSEADWTPNLTYLAIPTRNSVEIVENNLRYQKLIGPVKEGFIYKANTYLPSKPFESIYSFSVDEDIQSWESMYENVGMPESYNGLNFDETVTIRQVEDSVNVPIDIPDSYAYKILWNEQYAKGIGMISRNVEMWEYQPPTSGQPGFRTGFGVKMRIKNHN
jgi:hypothetical protein